VLQLASTRSKVWRGLAAGAVWVGLLWGWLTGYELFGRTVGHVVRASAFALPDR
jgi:hypothetical protein